VKNGLLRDYLQEKQGTEDVAVTGGGPGHEVPVHGEIHTIAGGFSGGGCTASQRRRCAQAVMSVEAQRTDNAFDVDPVFTKAYLQDVVPHDNDLVVISVVTTGKNVHRVLVDQGSSADVMFWTTFNKLQLSHDMLRPYGGCLYGFTEDQVEVRGHLELRTTFTDGTASHTESIRYLVFNASSAYNMLLSRPTLNRLGAVPSTGHMKMKLPNLAGKVITIKSDQKKVKRCYENDLKTKRGVFVVTTRPPYTEDVPQPEVSRTEIAWTKAEIARGKIAQESRHDPFGNPGERDIGGKVSKLSDTPDQTAQNLNAKVRPVHQRAKERHLINLEGLFEKIVEYKLKPKPEKCVFSIEPGKFLGSLLTERGKETNLERRMSVLSGFAPVGGGGGLPYQECKEAFIRLKEYLAIPSVLCKPQPNTSFSLYLVVIEAISLVLAQKQDLFQKLMRILGRVRQGPEERHQVPEKTAPLVSR